MKVTNTFDPVFNNDCKVLILGSMPSVISRKENFYYMNKNNRFYKIMSILLEEDLLNVDIEKKKEILLKHNIALFDVVQSCEIKGSSDSSIEKVNYSNIELIIKNSNINRIFLNGKKAYELFSKKYPDYLSISKCLPSTSSANATYSLADLIAEWSIIIK